MCLSHLIIPQATFLFQQKPCDAAEILQTYTQTHTLKKVVHQNLYKQVLDVVRKQNPKEQVRVLFTLLK